MLSVKHAKSIVHYALCIMQKTTTKVALFLKTIFIITIYLKK